jgi:hypothetical protein
VVFPGETITVRMWQDAGAVFVEALCKDRGTPVLSNAVIEAR